MDLNSDVKIYITTHKPYKFLNSEIFFPIAANKTLGDSLNIISSDTGDNIAHLNKYIAEFSTFYWAWKNDTTSKYISFFHYRRYLILNGSRSVDFNSNSVESYGFTKEYVKSLFENYDIFVMSPLRFDSVTIYEQYCLCHEKIIMDTALDFINKKYPDYYESFIKAFQKNYGYYANMFIMRREDFNDYMAFIFDVFENIKDVIFSSHQDKPFAYLAERLFSGYVEYLISIKNFKIKELPCYIYNEELPGYIYNG